jgi:phosphoribosyl 1,2-cyclic phosphodiesterase
MARLTAIVLRLGAGGGLPQWNCRRPVCELARTGDSRVRRSGRTRHFERRRPLESDQRLSRCETKARTHWDLRGSPIEAGVLAGAEIDEIAGLLSLRESSPFPLYATPGTHGQCHLRRARVARHALCHAADSIPDCNSGPCARPFLISGDARNPDPTCHLSPHHVRIAELAAAHEEGAFT